MATPFPWWLPQGASPDSVARFPARPSDVGSSTRATSHHYHVLAPEFRGFGKSTFAESIDGETQTLNWASKIPDCKTAVLPGVGHLSPLEAADAFNQAISRFCRANG